MGKKLFCIIFLGIFVISPICVWAANMGGIKSGETKSGNIVGPSFSDSWTFYGKAGDRVIINSVRTSGNLNTYMDLYSPAPDSVREVTTYPFGDQLGHKLLKTGMYTVLVQDYKLDHEGGYNITLLKIPGAVSSPGDQNGGQIASGQNLSGSCKASDMDAFQFYGKAGDRVIINSVRTSGNLNTYMDLYSPAPDSVREVTTYPFGDQLSHVLLKTGMYTVLVQDYKLDHEGKYNISLTKIPSNLRPGIYNPYPLNGSSVYNLNDSFSWDPVAGATGYDLYFGEDVIEPLLIIEDNLPSNSAPFPLMEWNKVYYWHVVAHTSGGDITGPYWWFYTQDSQVFSDVPPSHWAYDCIMAIYEAGITSGYADGTFRPKNNVNRAQMATFIVRALEEEPPANYCASGSPFPDVAPDFWACGHIKKFFELGITTGYSDGTFRPNNLVNRAQMACFLERAFLNSQ